MRHRADFERTFKEGRRRHYEGFDLVTRPDRESEGRVGFVVSRRLGNAVARNRIRRRLRHAIDPRQMTPGRDHIIIAKKRAADLDFGALQAALMEVLDSTPRGRLSPSARSQE